MFAIAEYGTDMNTVLKCTKCIEKLHRVMTPNLVIMSFSGIEVSTRGL